MDGWMNNTNEWMNEWHVNKGMNKQRNESIF